MGHDEHSSTAFDGRASNQLHHSTPQILVQRSRWLVGQKQRRFVNQSARDSDTLLLSAGELYRIVVSSLGHAEYLHDFASTTSRLTPRNLVEFQDKAHIFFRGEKRN